MKLQDKIKYLIEEIKVGMYERDELIKLSFLAMLSGESIFLLGLPGVAKSMIARRLKFTLKDGIEFEYLMNRFSSPEDIFGPISLSKLEDDKYERIIDQYMPSAHIVFLDEIWKASPSIQNTLLTIINEKIYKNGTENVHVPLKLLIAASNELPAKGEGLEALYDRFLLRYYVSPIVEEDNFNQLITLSDKELNIDRKKMLTVEDISKIKEKSQVVGVPKDILDFISNFRKSLIVKMKKAMPYISDRRWKKIVNMLKVNAYVSGKTQVDVADLLIIGHAVWETKEQRNAINTIFDELWHDAITLKTGVSLEDIRLHISAAQELNTTGYIYKQVHRHCQAEYDSQKYTYYAFKIENNEDLFWIPMANKEIISNHDGDQTYIYLTPKTIKRITNQSSGDAHYSSDWDIKKGLHEDGHKIIPIIDNSKNIDQAKLRQAKKICDANSLLIAQVINEIENEIKKIATIQSQFVDQYNNHLDKAKATILDQINEFNAQNTSVLGDVVSNLKNKE